MNALKIFYGKKKTGDRPVSSNNHPKLRNIYIRLARTRMFGTGGECCDFRLKIR